jgi:hypothetical protein
MASVFQVRSCGWLTRSHASCDEAAQGSENFGDAPPFDQCPEHWRSQWHPTICDRQECLPSRVSQVIPKDAIAYSSGFRPCGTSAHTRGSGFSRGIWGFPGVVFANRVRARFGIVHGRDGVFCTGVRLHRPGGERRVGQQFSFSPRLGLHRGFCSLLVGEFGVAWGFEHGDTEGTEEKAQFICQLADTAQRR